MQSCEGFAAQIKHNVKENNLSEMPGYYIWGVGTSMAMLVQMGFLSVDKIKGVFDSNKNIHGKRAYGHDIEEPMNLKDKKQYPIIVCSQYAYSSIVRTMNEMKLKNRVINVFE